MFGLFVFPTKPEDASYPYKKDPKMALKLEDEELVHFVKKTPKMVYFCHHKDECNNLPVEEMFKVVEKYVDRQYLPLKKVRGIDNAYVTEDGTKYVKVIVKSKDWFSRYFV